jgi:hypothetical protein
MPFDLIGLLGIVCIVLAIFILIGVGHVGGGLVAAVVLGLLGLFLVGGRYGTRNRL